MCARQTKGIRTLSNRQFNHKNITALALFSAALLPGCNSDSATDEPAIASALSADYVAIRVEAENYSEKSARWYLTTQDISPDVADDPDPPHYSTASGSGYLELLPDTRVTHDDTLNRGENYWGDSTGGPSITYRLDIPEPGRYLVYTKAYSTGTEDNGIHVGLNNNDPESGKRIQLCGGKRKWTWSSAQRVPENHCGVEKTIYLDITQAGVNEIFFYAREDGFEIDQFILLKEPADGKVGCEPHGFGHKIRCTDNDSGDEIGTYDLPLTETVDGNYVAPPAPSLDEVDLDIDIDVANSSVRVGNEFIYQIEVTNKDQDNDAPSVEVEVSLPDSITFLSSDFCQHDNGEVECEINEIVADSAITLSFSASANTEGMHRVDAQVTADVDDKKMGNNAASTEVDAAPAIPPYAAAVSVIRGTNTMGSNQPSTHLLIVKNTGTETISDASFSFTSTGLEVSGEAVACSTESCVLGDINPGASTSIPVAVSGSEAGFDTLVATLNVAGDDDTTDNTVTIPLRITSQLTYASADGSTAFEAEDFSSQSNIGPLAEGAYTSAWFVYSPELPPAETTGEDTTPDFDSSFPDYDSTAPGTASGSAYVELLPDTRTVNSDSPLIGVSNFPTGDQSPYLSFDVFFNEGGRYNVHARIRSNNDQDAAIHVGVNGEWNTDASKVTVCNPTGEWAWTNHTADNEACVTDSAAGLTISSPGVHRVMIAAATDGVELDKVVLSKSDALQPEGFGPETAFYVPTEIDLAITSTASNGIYRVEVINPDSVETATAIQVSIEGEETLALGDGLGFDRCTNENGQLSCEFDYVSPGSSRIAEFPLESEDQTITANLAQANDPNTDNNASTVSTSGGGSINPGLSLLLLLLSVARLSFRYTDRS